MKHPSEILPKFIISLQNNQERLQYVKDKIIPKLQSTILTSAVDYKVDDLNKLLTDNNLKVSDNFFENGRVGQLACFLSHFLIWKFIVKNKIDMCIVLEDDVKIYKNFNKTIDKIYDNLPIKFDYVHLFVHPDKQKIEYLDGNEGDLIPAEDNFGTVAYMISLRGAKRLLKLSKLLKIQAPVDKHINFCIKHNFLKAFMIKRPFLITQGEILPNRSIYQDSFKSTIWYSPIMKDTSFISYSNICPPGFTAEELNEIASKTKKTEKKEEIILTDDNILNNNKQGPPLEKLFNQDEENQELQNENKILKSEKIQVVQHQNLKNQNEENQNEENEVLQHQNVENENVENQNLENQNEENENVENQNLENQNEENENVENQNLENQNEENEVLQHQNVENENVENQNQENQNEENLHNENEENENLEHPNVENENLEHQNVENENQENEENNEEDDNIIKNIVEKLIVSDSKTDENIEENL